MKVNQLHIGQLVAYPSAVHGPIVGSLTAINGDIATLQHLLVGSGSLPRTSIDVNLKHLKLVQTLFN